MAVGESRLPLKTMQLRGPTQAMTGAELRGRGGRKPVVGEISVAGQDGIWPAKVRAHAHEITEVIV